MELITEREIIEIRDKQPMVESKRQTKETMERMGYVSLREIFRTMGYEHRYNDKWEKVK